MVANAGFGAPTRLDPLNTHDVEQTIRVNVLGVIYSIEAVLPGMIARRSGHLLAVSSLAAFKGLPGESAYCASKAAVNAYMEGLRIALRSKGVVVTTVCPGFVETPMTPMDTATPFLMSADAAARRIARLIARRRGGVARFPLPMSLLMSLIARLPDAIVARLVRVEAEPRAGQDGGVSPMIDLALKMLLDEKVRFAATVFGVGFAAALVLIQVGLFFGLLENASITIERLDADLWVTARNTPNVDFGNPFPETYVQRVRSIPGVARADNLIVWYAIVALPTGAKESVIYYGLEDFPAWHFPWNVESGDPADLRRGRYVMLDASAERRFGPFRAGDYREFQGRRLKIIGRTREALSFTTSPVAFLDYGLAQSLSPDELHGRTTFIVVRLEPGADVAAVRREIRRRLPYNDVYDQAEWAARSRGYWIESTGLGLTLFLTVTLGRPGRRGHRGADALRVDDRAPGRFRHGQGAGRRQPDGLLRSSPSRRRTRRPWAMVWPWPWRLAWRRSWRSFDMKMIVSPTLAGLVFVGTQALCVGAASLSFRKVASLDPAIVFRG